MPKILEYPRAGIRRSLSLAEEVDRLGGECTEESAAESMGNKVGGAFRALAYSAQKYGFISYNKGKLKTEPLYQDYKLAYTDAQKQETLRKAFLAVPLFNELVKRFNGQVLPGHFEKLLIREHQVTEDMASRVSTYFIEGGQDSGLISSSGMVTAEPGNNTTITPRTGTVTFQGHVPTVSAPQAVPAEESSPVTVRGYTVRVTGPGIDSTIAIKDSDDLLIVESMLKKVRKLLIAEDEMLK
jgi:hypothetical protein